MKLNVILPWLCVLGVSAGLASVFVKSNAKEAELVKLREENQQAQQLQTELDEVKDQVKQRQDELAGLRKDKEELLRLRNEIRKVQDEKIQLLKQAQSAQSEAQRAQAQANEARTSNQQMFQENQQLKSVATQNQQVAPQVAQQMNACINNLRQLDGAKQQWALEHQKTVEAVPTPSEVAAYLGTGNNVWPVCPAGGVYSLNAVGQPTRCSVPGHALPTQQ